MRSSQTAWKAGERDEVGQGGFRDTRDDFYCLRHSVWYNSVDCAYRTKFHTCPSCENCEQGRFNHKRHNDALSVVQPLRFLAADPSAR